jgi:hypothetical protein
MSKLKSSPFTVLRLTFNIFKLEHRQIFYPFIIIVFINLLVLEILYFLPRYPLSVFFTPIISRIWGEQFMHYPMNLMLLPKLFYYAQMVIFLFFSSILIAMVADMVAAVNNEKPVNFKASLQKSLPGYVYIVIYAFLFLLLSQAFYNAYGLLIRRALKIHSTAGIYFWIKECIFYAAPYSQFLYSIFVTTFLIYIPILIILEKKKFLAALIINFKTLFGSLWLTFILVLVPALFYIPYLLMQNNMGRLVDMTVPEVQVLVIAVCIFLTTAINIFIVASATTYYLYKKENS